LLDHYIDNRQLLSNAIDKFSLSTSAYHCIFKVARIIADLEDKKVVDKSHLIEAIGYRRDA
jgi:magnesium chelatase family protein